MLSTLSWAVHPRAPVLERGAHIISAVRQKVDGNPATPHKILLEGTHPGQREDGLALESYRERLNCMASESWRDATNVSVLSLFPTPPTNTIFTGLPLTQQGIGLGSTLESP